MQAWLRLSPNGALRGVPAERVAKATAAQRGGWSAGGDFPLLYEIVF